MKQCKQCNEWKSENDFYLKGHFVNGKYYVNFSTLCKSCILFNAKQRRKYGYKPQKKVKVKEMSYCLNSDGIAKQTESNYNIRKKPIKEIEKYDWVLGNLKKFGNCFIGKKNEADIDEIRRKLNKNINVRQFENGYILEVVG